jgi:glutamate:GABA antiporter
VPITELRAIQGVIQAVSAGVSSVGQQWIVAPLALLLAVSIGGAASAWFAGSARVPFVAGLTNTLPRALGRVHPTWGSPHVALIACGVLAAGFTVFSLAGSTVAEAYQVLLKAAVVIQLLPFLYLFAALARLRDQGWSTRAAAVVGFGTTSFGVVAAFVPPSEATSAMVFEFKMALGVLIPLAAGLYFYRRGRQ